MKISDIWCEKYRPSTLDEIVLDRNTKTYFNKVQVEQNIPNVLFVYGTDNNPNIVGNRSILDATEFISL